MRRAAATDIALRRHLGVLRTPSEPWWANPSRTAWQTRAPLSVAHLEHVETSDDPRLGSHLGA